MWKLKVRLMAPDLSKFRDELYCPVLSYRAGGRCIPCSQPTCILTQHHRQLAHQLAALEPSDPFRHKHESLLLEKLYDMGIFGTAGAGGRGKLSEVEKKVTVSSMCRRRLGVVMTRLKMADTVQAVCELQIPDGRRSKLGHRLRVEIAAYKVDFL